MMVWILLQGERGGAPGEASLGKDTPAAAMALAASTPGLVLVPVRGGARVGPGGQGLTDLEAQEVVVVVVVVVAAAALEAQASSKVCPAGETWIICSGGSGG
jgi:hypothetical protein